ncbi:MAG: SpoIIE family protein phosphatase [Proteobacteria bacterium]|nr:SpoIIE family protein phosphatase [Pseudomonadota bacterium]
MNDMKIIPVFNQTFRTEVTEMSQVGEARRMAFEISAFIGLSETEAGTVSIIVSEIAKNLIKHAGCGEVLISPVQYRDEFWIDILGLDKGPGIAGMAQCMQDGYSTTGSPGTGLGAVKRLSTIFDIISAPAAGTAVLSRLIRKQEKVKQLPPLMDIGVVNVPINSEQVSGDGWAVAESSGRTVLMAADGLGHGVLASDAARAAEKVFREQSFLGPTELLEYIHNSIKHTRGAAVAIAEVTHAKNMLKYSGIGNITGILHTAEKSRNMVSMNGTAGGEARKMQEFAYPFAPAENSRQPLIIMHSDGIATISALDRYPGIENRHPALIAGIVYKDFRRGRDDAMVLVAKKRP